MFKFLKEKLKSWVKKAEEPEKPIENPTKISAKPEKKSNKGKKVKIIEKPQESKKEIKQKERIEEPIEEPKEKQKTGFSFFKKRITSEKFEELFGELNMILLQNNVALEVVDKIKLSLENKLLGQNQSNTNIQQSLKESIEETLTNPPDFIMEIKKTLAVKQPFVIAFVGINGSGKTTTIAKIANLLKSKKMTCCVAAADTFRAASIEQLQKHADNIKIPIIKKDYGSDPASVGFDAIQYAKKHHLDIVLIDTAGRMNTKDSLMREMEKIVRVTKPDMTVFVGESITGNDATEQAKAFNETTNLTGIILSKADVDEKGGTAISVSYITKKPILFLGTGQSYEDLEVFDKERILKSLGLG